MNGQPPYASHGRYGQPSSEPYGDSYTPDPSALGDAGPGDYPSARRVGGGRGGGGGGTGDSGYGGLGADPFEENAQRPRSRNNVEAPSRPRYGRGLTVGRDDRSYSDSNRSRDRMGRGLEERSTTQSNSRSQQSMEDILKYIQMDWPFMGGEECIPVQVALQLSDPSSLGLAAREQEFRQVQDDLQMALKTIVNEHHQDFNSSIGTYHKIQGSIQNSQVRVRYLKNALEEAKNGLLTTKPELKDLATSSRAFDDSLQIFNKIESIQSMPEKLEGAITEKRFLTAVDLLQEALRLVRKSEFDNIGAMGDLRLYFANQEQSLMDILIEELHGHLYLKSPYCHDRWKTPTNSSKPNGPPISPDSHVMSSWDKPVYHYLAALNASAPMVEDASRNPESDTFYYIHMIMEAVHKMGHLDTAVSRIEQRLPVELFKVVDKSNNDIDARYPSEGQSHNDLGRQQPAPPTSSPHSRSAVLSEFLWTVFAKFEAIAEGHRVVHDVVAGIVAREELPHAATYMGGFKELWKIYQSEIRSLLHDYLATDGDTTLHAGLAKADRGDVFVRKRDKNKRIFRLAEMDQKSPDMQSEQKDLDEILKSSVPGLISKTRGKVGTTSEMSQPVQESTAAGHKLLVTPDVFNVTLLLPLSLTFLQRLRDIFPSTADIPVGTLTSFLDDFLVNVFYPQLEDTISELCAKCIIDIEAFTEDPLWAKQSPRPVFKGTIAFMSLIKEFAALLGAIPQDPMFTQLIITQLVTYFDKCLGWFKALTSRLSGPMQNAPSTKAAAVFAREGRVQEVLTKLLDARHDVAAPEQLIKDEVDILLAETKANPLSAYDMVSDPKSVSSISLLHNSLQWLSASLDRLRRVEPVAESRSTLKLKRWTAVASQRPVLVNSKSSTGSQSPPFIPLTSETVVAFDKTVQELRGLARIALLTLHVDLRCGVIHSLTKSLRGANNTTLDQPSTTLPTPSQDPTGSAFAAEEKQNYSWLLQQPPTAASPLVLELNNDLIAFDTSASSSLGTKERVFVNRGLGQLIDHLLVAGADKIEVMNSYGAQRMGLDILVLQQNLRNIAITTSSTPGSADMISVHRDTGISSGSGGDADIVLEKSAGFYNLFLSGPDKTIETVKRAKIEGLGKNDPPIASYSFDELKTLIELCYSEGLRSNEKGREESLKARKGLQDSLLWLEEAMWEGNHGDGDDAGDVADQAEAES